jgi:hypothetical protein
MSFSNWLRINGVNGDLETWEDRRDLVNSFIGDPATYDDLEKQINDDNLKWFDISERIFLQLALCAGEIRYEDYRPRKAYNIHESTLEVDQYVNQVLKEYFSDMKERVSGFTRTGRYTRALAGLLKFGIKLAPKTALYNNSRMNSLYEKNWEEVTQLLLNANDGKKFETISLNQAIERIPLNTAAGYSFPGKKKVEVAHLALNYAKKMKWNIESGRFQKKIPCTLAVRGHLSPIDENKSRLVWVMPFETILLECTIFNEFYRLLKTTDRLPFITGNKAMQRLWKYLDSYPNMKMVSGDISGWDTMRGRFLIYDAFRFMRNIINLSPREEKLYRWILHDFTETHFILPSGIVLSKSSGVPSGTYLTLLFNCIINYVAQKTVMQYMNLDFHSLSILGDDNSFFIRSFPPEKVLEYARLLTEYFGLLSHPDKTDVYDKVSERKFLGYNFKNMRLYRTTDDWFKLALLPEREVKDIRILY